jgi:hypothetical protein
MLEVGEPKVEHRGGRAQHELHQPRDEMSQPVVVERHHVDRDELRQ